MPVIQIDPANMAAAEKSIPKDTPIAMLNLVRFRAQAFYPSSDSSLPAVSGEEAYMGRYIPMWLSIAAETLGTSGEEVKPIFLGNPIIGLVVPKEEEGGHAGHSYWDNTALVRYPSLEVFRKITECKKYEEEALQHRNAGLEDWRLFVTTEVDMASAMAGGSGAA